jgi:hypothetical protein
MLSGQPLSLLLHVARMLRVPVLERSTHPEARLRERLWSLARRTRYVTVEVAGQVDGLLEGFENRSSESGSSLHTPNGQIQARMLRF